MNSVTRGVLTLARQLEHVLDMESKNKLFGHPIHPMFVGFPIALFGVTFVAYLTYAATGRVFFFHLGVVANVVSAIGATMAAVPGFLDWAWAVPTRHPAKSMGLQQVLLYVLGLGAIVADAVIQISRWSTPFAPYASAIGLSGAAFLLALGAGAMGWKIIDEHGGEPYALPAR